MSNKSLELIDKLEYYSNLFDFYESLFTDKQKEYFKDYYFYDLSLSEIATNHQISRSAVYDVINKMHTALDEYECNLGLYKKSELLKTIVEEYENKANKSNNILLLEFVNKIKEIE